MTNRLRLSVPLAAVVLLLGCIDVPDIVDPPDAGQPPADAGQQQDGGGTPDAGPADTLPPTIRTTTPLGGATQVSIHTGLVLTFSETMKQSSVRVTLQPEHPLGNPAWSLQGTMLTVGVASPLSENTLYTVTVVGEDLVGNALSGTHSLSFTTEGPAPDTTPPTVLFTTPVNGAIGAGRNTLLEVVFSEPMERGSVETAFAILSPAGFNTGTFAWNAASTVMTYTLPSSLAHGTNLHWQVTATARDVAGNPLVETLSRNFRTMRQAITTFDFDLRTSGPLSAPDFSRQTSFYNGANVGDWSGDLSYRLFLGFQMTSLPEELVFIRQAQIKWWATGQRGDPYGKLGRLLLEPVDVGEELPTSFDFDPRLEAAYHSQPLSSGIPVPSDSLGRPGRIDVTAVVAQDWANRATRNKRTQYRLRFEIGTNNDGNVDSIDSNVEEDPKLAELEVTYEYP
ncbi:Ig-like domain-containing protein [Myxococcus sp. CA051A]|uniref:Ig-like domain-containing protein n=1 Tax=Myxococcus sp. CA051A TaxID=2741739 RepID=UPI00157AD0B1|nr:Ig-like domain-containing protein [Myxococcus sp. CA051A]NTX60081.1 Ig-like domain-containing protein [Myxococcus sp. CA051A]